MLMLFVSKKHFSSTGATILEKFTEHMEQFPRLKIVHTKRHCISATSAAMERVFSAAG